jgi:endonuclease/exonuclease/phosphatase family metal-dependent hydrolase
MQILTWNIQMAKGVDDVTSIERIAGVIEEMGSGDVICCQEVGQEIDAQGRLLLDQPGELQNLFPGFEVFYGAAIDRFIDGKRLRFGNIVLSRLPVLSIAHHRLPQPADTETPNMARQAIELIVAWKGVPYRIMCTHLEYFSSIQRAAQVDYLCAVYREACARAESPSLEGGPGYYQGAPETRNTILCGDLNLTPGSAHYQKIVGESHGAQLLDAWLTLNPGQEHLPTCGIFDRVQWSEGPHCRDYLFVSPEIARSLHGMSVNTQTDASDHQPVKLTLGLN